MYISFYVSMCSFISKGTDSDENLSETLTQLVLELGESVRESAYTELDEFLRKENINKATKLV